MQNKKIVITGGPGTGKSSIIDQLELRGHTCLHEVSREITAEAQRHGIDQLFLEEPVLFSEKLLDARIVQHAQALNASEDLVFIDRGIPDVVAYLNYFGNSYPAKFNNACSKYFYDHIFLLPPWKDIYHTDKERYESFDQASLIYNYIKKTYITLGYFPIEVPLESVELRCEFILSNTQQ